MFCDLSTVRSGDAIYRDHYFVKRGTLSSGTNRSASRRLVDAQMQFGRNRVFDLRAESSLGPFALHLTPVDGGSRLPFQKPTKYEGKIVLPNMKEGVVIFANQIGQPLVSISIGSDTINLDRGRIRDPYSEYVLSIASLGHIAELLPDEAGMTLKELWASRFGFGQVMIGKWIHEPGVIHVIESPAIGNPLLAVMLLHETLIPRTVAPPTPIGS